MKPTQLWICWEEVRINWGAVWLTTFLVAFYPNSDGGMISVFHSDTTDLQVQGEEVRVRPVHLLHFGRRQAYGSLFRWNDLVVLRGRGSAPGLKSQPGSH